MMRQTVALQDSVHRFNLQCTDMSESVFLSLKPLSRVWRCLDEDVNRFD